MAVQIALEYQGYEVGKVDGLRGNSTKNAVLKFQTDRMEETERDGFPGPKTIKKIIENLGATTAENTSEKTENTSEKTENTSEKTENTSETAENTSEKIEQQKITSVVSLPITESMKSGTIPRIQKIGDVYVPLTKRIFKEKTVGGYKTFFEAQKRLAFEQEWEKGTKHITNITDERCEEIIAKHQGYLSLDGLSSLTDKQAESLAKYQGIVILDGLSSLTDKQAESLAKHQGEVLYLDGLKSLTDKQAESLAKYQGYLYLPSNLKLKINQYRTS